MTSPDRKIVTERREWVVTASGPWGATQADVHKKLALAIASYRTHHNIPNGEPIYDDAIRVVPRDEEIVIFYEAEAES